MTKPIDTPKASATIIPMPLTKKDKRRAEDKFSVQVMKGGYTILPNLLLKAQGKLGITPPQFNVLIQLLQYWWDADKVPFVAKDTIARRMGKSPRQVQRYITELEEAGLVGRVERFSGVKAQTANGYVFDGLIKKLKAVEPEFAKADALKRTRQQKVETPATAAG